MRLGKLSSGNGSSRRLQRLAASTHGTLYALLLARPLLGWALSSAQGKPVHLLGASLPALVAADEDLADALQRAGEPTGSGPHSSCTTTCRSRQNRSIRAPK